MTNPRWGGAGIFRQGLRAAREAAERLREALGRHRGSTLLPPRYLRDVGPGDFEEIGREFLGHMICLASLQPSESVLEIGCGPGRLALPLSTYLSDKGRYAGVDVVAKAVAWCRRNISRRHPNFAFHHADVLNQRYNPGGKFEARTYTFPFPDHSFDFILLASVFTHMYPTDTQHYLQEIARMLRPTGRVLATFFLLNPEQRALAEQGRNHIDFRFERDAFRVRDDALPESAVAVEERATRGMLEDAGLIIQKPIRFGRWSGRDDGLSFQDIVLTMPANQGSAERR
jgi:SAM-dependent methyltransferase